MIGQSIWLRGFRPFFLGASLFAVQTMVTWLLVYRSGRSLRLEGISIFQWHAHEMLYGYSMAVIAGFLLTAAWNWTGHRTASGPGLAVIFLFWLAARVLMVNGTAFLPYAAAADLAFMLGLGIAVARPIIRVRQKRQALVLVMLALLAAGNVLFYLGAVGVVDGGTRHGLYAGLYLVLGMVLFMGRRVIPFFTERGVGYEVKLRNDRWNDLSTIALYPLFAVSEIFFPHHAAGAVLASLLLVLNSVRVGRWHTLGIWQKPLLWGLFAAFLMINLGFLLRALALVTTVADYLPVHAYAVGGIGVVTLSMMARVTLGHTGRNVHRAPPIMAWLLIGMALTAVIRVFLPLIDPGHYTLWITVSGVMWIVSFTLFAIIFVPMLVRPRVDDKP